MEDNYEEYVCSQCGYETDTSKDSEFDCPHCGIKMDLKKEEKSAPKL